MVVLSTVGDSATARRIAATLVQENLAACVNVTGPIRSTYRWRGAVTTDSERLMLIKTRSSLLSTLERRLRELHPYEVPEIVAIELRAGSKAYLDWLIQETSGSRPTSNKSGRA